MKPFYYSFSTSIDSPDSDLLEGNLYIGLISHERDTVYSWVGGGAEYHLKQGFLSIETGIDLAKEPVFRKNFDYLHTGQEPAGMYFVFSIFGQSR